MIPFLKHALSSVNIPSAPALKFTNEFTIEMWYKDPNGVGGGSFTLVSKEPVSPSCAYPQVPGNYILSVAGADYYMQVDFSDPNTGLAGLNYWPLPLGGMFHHLAASYKQASSTTVQIKLYLDGTAVLTNSISGNLANTLRACFKNADFLL